MSYCRWSSDDFGCDVYCYESCMGGYEIHVAGNRVVGEVPRLVIKDDGASIDMVAFMGSYQAQMAYLKTAEREPIGLPCDGDSYNVGTAGEAADKLEELREMGYRVPDYAIQALREESLHNLTPP